MYARVLNALLLELKIVTCNYNLSSVGYFQKTIWFFNYHSSGLNYQCTMCSLFAVSHYVRSMKRSVLVAIVAMTTNNCKYHFHIGGLPCDNNISIKIRSFAPFYQSLTTRYWHDLHYCEGLLSNLDSVLLVYL